MPAAMPRIVQARFIRVAVPVDQAWAASPEFGGQPIGPHKVLLRLTDSDGFTGWGEGLHRTTDLGHAVAPRLIGQPLAELRPSFLDLHAPGSSYWQLPVPPSPWTPPLANLGYRLRHPMQPLVEMALLDLLARRAGVPLHMLFGGKWRDVVVVDYWMGRTTPEHAARCARRGRELGFHGIKLKTTLEDPNVTRLEAIRDAAGPDFPVTVDPNSRFYRLDDAWKTIQALDRIGNMAILEDPFPRHFLDDYKALRPRLDARLVVHLDPPESLTAVLAADCCGGMNLDSHVQGLAGFRAAAATCDYRNLPVWHGSSLDLGIATAAQLHVASATPNCQLPGDQVGPWIRESHLLKQGFEIRSGGLAVPEGPGLGIEVDLDAVDRYTQDQAEFD